MYMRHWSITAWWQGQSNGVTWTHVESPTPNAYSGTIIKRSSMPIQVSTQQTCYVVNPPTPLNTPWLYTSTEQDFLRVPRFSPFTVIPQMLYTHSPTIDVLKWQCHQITRLKQRKKLLTSTFQDFSLASLSLSLVVALSTHNPGSVMNDTTFHTAITNIKKAN